MSTQENKVCLYIFTHNKTGLRYFGKTIRFFDEESLLKYGGSGIYWNAHIKKHGKDLSVEIYGIYNIDEVEEIAIKFSDYNNITESRNLANLKPENGHDGGNNRIEIIDKETGLSNFQVSSKKAMDML